MSKLGSVTTPNNQGSYLFFVREKINNILVCTVNMKQLPWLCPKLSKFSDKSYHIGFIIQKLKCKTYELWFCQAIPSHGSVTSWRLHSSPLFLWYRCFHLTFCKKGNGYFPTNFQLRIK